MQRFPRTDLIIDVEIDPVPADDRAGFVAERLQARIEPAIRIILAAQPVLEAERLAGGEGFSKQVQGLGTIVGMYELGKSGERKADVRRGVAGFDAGPVDE